MFIEPPPAEDMPLFPLMAGGPLLLPTLLDAEAAAEIELVVIFLSLRPLNAVAADVDGNGESLVVLLLPS